jgi:hypothetical protein
MKVCMKKNIHKIGKSGQGYVVQVNCVYVLYEELDGPAVSALGVRSWKLSNIGQSSDGWPKIYYLELRASESMLSR